MSVFKGRYIVADRHVLQKLKKTGITVSAFDTRWGDRRYTRPCDPTRKPKKTVLYRIHVRLK